jgi:RNA polymerase sigma factor (sigma-70 family)
VEIAGSVTPQRVPKFVASGGRPPRLREDRLPLDARDLLVANLDLVDRVVAFTSRRARLDESDAEEFASVVKLKLVENDYAIIRKFEGRSSFSTFLAVVVQRMLLDYRIHMWGKWHPSAEAKRMGDLAVELEKLLHRDGRTLEEAATQLRAVPRDELQRLAGALPPRGPKRRMVDLEEAASVSTPPAAPDSDRTRTSAALSSIVQRFLAQLPPDDRLMLQLRFDSGMTVAQIARSLNEDQKAMYRRMERRLREMRAELERAGIASEDAHALIGDQGVVLDFQLGSAQRRPSREEERHEGTSQ